MTDLSALKAAEFDTIIDVRSPSEFAKDHLPGAINLPVLSDEERARVGTIYKQDSPFKARKVGAALVAKNAARHIEGPLADFEGDWRGLVYCWRGGQRSGSFASILSQIGWRVETLAGGYQSYRRQVVACLYDRPFPAQVILLDGNTGTAKTEVISRLSGHGIQTLDLEGLANHRGSALGAHGPQPGQKAFETRLAGKITDLDHKRPVIIEAESSKIGRLNIPPSLFDVMKSARRIEISAPLEARAAYLCRAYSDLISDTDAMIERLRRLVPIQGHDRVEEWATLARSGEHAELATELIREHYDPRYAKSRARHARDAHVVDVVRLDDKGIDTVATRIARFVKDL